MRILFIGGGIRTHEERSMEEDERIVATHQPLWLAAADLGRKAAERGHTVMLGSDRETTIDHYVMRDGFLPTAKQHPDRRFFAEIYRPDGTKRPYESEVLDTNVHANWYVKRPGFPPEMKAVEVGVDRDPGTPLWLFAHQSAVVGADVVIAMCGVQGTRTAALVAENLEVPLIPIPYFGGAARDVYDGCRDSLPNTEARQHVSANWPDGRETEQEKRLAESRAEGIIRYAEQIGQHSYFLSHSHKELEWCDLVNLILFETKRTAIRDRMELKVGHPVQEKLYQEIGRSETFVLLWSKHSAASEWCQDELDVAFKLNQQGLPPRRIVLLIKDDTPLPESVKDCLQRDCRSSDVKALRTMTEAAVKKIVEEERISPPTQG